MCARSSGGPALALSELRVTNRKTRVKKRCWPSTPASSQSRSFSGGAANSRYSAFRCRFYFLRCCRPGGRWLFFYGGLWRSATRDGSFNFSAMDLPLLCCRVRPGCGCLTACRFIGLTEVEQRSQAEDARGHQNVSCHTSDKPAFLDTFGNGIPGISGVGPGLPIIRRWG